jgi:hypothetical protein
MIRKLVTFVAALGLGLLPCLSMAATTNESEKAAEQFNGYESAAWAAMQKDLAKVIPEHEASELTLVAYHAVAEMLCDNVKMDMEKVKAVVTNLHPTNWDDLNEQDHKQWEHLILVNYGMIVGVMLAEHADNAPPMCEDARAMIADKENDWHFFMVQAKP